MEINKVTPENGKFKILSPNNLINIINFITVRENTCILFEINKFFSKLIMKQYRKDNSINNCLKEMKSIIKQTEEFKFVTNNHCINLDENLKKFSLTYSPFTFNRSVYLLSSLIFKETQSLDLQKNNIGQDGVLLLIPLLKKTQNLVHINLSSNNVSDEGCKYLSHALKKNNTLQILNLECNGISDDGVNSLGEALISHKMMRTVKMALNIVTIEGVKTIAGLFEKNNSQIMVIDFKYNNFVIKDDFQMEYFRKHKITF